MTTEAVPLLELTPADVADLTDTLRPYYAISGSFFSRSESRAWAERYRHGLLSPLARTSVEPMVIAQHGASEQAVRGMQQCLTDSTWNDAAILRRHWQEVAVDLDDTEVWHMSFWCACSSACCCRCRPVGVRMSSIRSRPSSAGTRRPAPVSTVAPNAGLPIWTYSEVAAPVRLLHR